MGRRITKAERQERDALMRVINLVHIIVIDRLLKEGWGVREIAEVYENIQREAGRIAIEEAGPDWNFVDENKVAERVHASVAQYGERLEER